jgi:urease gamma subunit
MGSPAPRPIQYSPDWANATHNARRDAWNNTSAQKVDVPTTTASRYGLAAILYVLHGGYCEAMFEALALRSPAELIEIIRDSRAADTRLTYAAEILGRDVDTDDAVATLIETLRHESRFVREGAVLGLSYHVRKHGVRDALRRIAAEDESPGVKEAVADALDED